MMWHFKKSVAKAAKEEEGYTLLELLVVLVILAVLAGLAGPAILRQFGKAKTDAAKVAVQRLVTDLEYFRVDVGRFPTSAEGLNALYNGDGITGWAGPYVPKSSQLKDPWGNDFIYVVENDGEKVTVTSYGSDGAENGNTLDAQDVSASNSD